MRFISVSFCICIVIASAAGQSWEPVSARIQKFSIRDSSVFSEKTVYRQGGKFILIDRLAEKDFTKLFTEDSSAFGLMHDRMPRVPFMFLYDSSFSTLLDIGEREEVVVLYNRKVETKNDAVRWYLMSKSLSSPGCYATIIMKRIWKRKTMLLKVLDITGYCLIP